ncbi:MAG: hypothetical protein ABEJ87_04715 [Candidatus Nanohalobium sp.]
MTVVNSLAVINLVLDILVKVVFLALFVFGLLVLRKFEDVIESAERSAESVEQTAETVERLVKVADFLPFVGSKRKAVEAEEVDEDDE